MIAHVVDTIDGHINETVVNLDHVDMMVKTPTRVRGSFNYFVVVGGKNWTLTEDTGEALFNVYSQMYATEPVKTKGVREHQPVTPKGSKITLWLI